MPKRRRVVSVERGEEPFVRPLEPAVIHVLDVLGRYVVTKYRLRLHDGMWSFLVPTDRRSRCRVIDRIWTRTVGCRTARKQALRDAIRQLPLGVTWDLVIRHKDDWTSLQCAGELAFCSCTTLTANRGVTC